MPEIRRAQAAVHGMPLATGALGKSGKDCKGKTNNNSNNNSNNNPMSFFNCGKNGHVQKDCRAAGGGAANDKRKRGKQCNGGNNGEADAPTC